MDAETEARRVQGGRPRCQSQHERQSWDRNAGSLAPTQSELRLCKSRSGHQDWPWAGGVPRFALCCGSGSWRLLSTTCPTDRLLGGCGRGCPSISTQAVRGQPAGLPSRTCEPCPEGHAHRAAWPLRWQRGPSALSCQVSGQGDARHGRVHGLAEPRGPHGAAVISSDRLEWLLLQECPSLARGQSGSPDSGPAGLGPHSAVPDRCRATCRAACWG